MCYATLAINVTVYETFDYHIPPESTGKLQPGHLVRVSFGTAVQPGIVLDIHDTPPTDKDGSAITTKPIIDLLDPLPVVTDDQIDLAWWLCRQYLAPVGSCLWLMLPPGMVGKRDVLVTLVQPDAVRDDPLEARIIDVLKRRGTLRGDQIRASVKQKSWQKALRPLVDAGIVQTESILAPPAVKRKVIQVASLAIQPEHIPEILGLLGKSNRESDLLEAIAIWTDERDEPPTVWDMLSLPGVGEGTLDNLIDSDDIHLEDGTNIILDVPYETLDERLFTLRGGETDLHILRVLARENRPVDVSWVYAQTGCKLPDLKRLEERGLIDLGEKQAVRDPLADRTFIPMTPPRLTPGQRAVWAVVRAAMEGENLTPPSTPPPSPLPVDREQNESAGVTKVPSSRNARPSPAGRGFRGAVKQAGVNGEVNTTITSKIFLLHGVTGSGKTEIYLRAIEKTLAQGRQAIFLVPEIALTGQTIRRVMARFPGQVAILGDEEGETSPDQIALVHSKLKPGERYDTWVRARAGEIGVVVGTRSALFTPLPDVGLVILDEEHDPSYKQSPPAVYSQVYYHARDVAEHMMRENDGVLILGSATPDLESYFRAQRGDIMYLRLPDRIVGHRLTITEQAKQEGVQPRYQRESDGHSDALTIPMPDVQIIDMREELAADNTSIFSRELQTALEQVLARGEQAILFLNRRGTSTYVFCRDCGYVVVCPRCDTPLTYHDHDSRLHCHHCGHIQQSPTTCPNCQSKRIKFFGAGTQQVEAALQNHFPHARGLRWDSDTAAKPGAHDLILQRFSQRQADVLIGTQMIAKGLDFPLVTLVGVVSADTGLALPDFRAAERTFQLMAQVAGRAGRGLLGGRVILQTYHPEHYAITTAAQHDYAAFYEREIAFRRELGYPPFRRLVRILFRSEKATTAQTEAQRAAERLRQRITELDMTGTDIIGPVPCFFTRINRVYRWQVILRGPYPMTVLQGMKLPPGWYVDVDPVDVL